MNSRYFSYSIWIAVASLAASPVGAQPPLSPVEQSRALEIARSNALHYIETLPDFICTEIVQRSSSLISSYEGKRGGAPVSSSDKLTIQLSYFGQKEAYKLLAINGSPTSKSFDSLPGILSGGESGGMLRRIFAPDSAAQFRWKSWATIAKRKCAVYSYRVERSNSHHAVGDRTGAGKMRTTVVGHTGVIALDSQTSMVLHPTMEAFDIPPAFQIRNASTAVDYAYTNVGGHEHLLPAGAETAMSRSLGSPPSTSDTANIVSFVGYQKFSADANIDFSLGDPKKKSESDTGYSGNTICSYSFQIPNLQ